MDLEQIWYEAFPFLYGIGGLVAMFRPGGSWLLKISGVLLIVASLTIIRLRFVYRRTLRAQTPTTRDTIRGLPADDD